MKNRVLAFAAIAEAATGITLIFAPLLVGRLMLGAEFSDVAVIAGRVAGIALIALGVACWPCENASCALCGMLTYSLLATLYLFYLGIAGGFTGILLWPAVAVHAVLTVLLLRTWLNKRKPDQATEETGVGG